MKLNYVNRDLRVKDFDLGWGLSGRFGFAPEFLGSSATRAPCGSGREGARLGERDSSSPRCRTRRDWTAGSRTRSSRPRSTSSGSSRRAISRRSSRSSGTTRAGTSTGTSSSSRTGWWTSGLPPVLVLGRQADDRESRASRFPRQGNAASLLAGRRVLRRHRRGRPEGTPLRPSEIKTDIGMGLRMSISRAPTSNVYRIDFAYALDPDPKGRRGLLVSFSASQGF